MRNSILTALLTLALCGTLVAGQDVTASASVSPGSTSATVAATAPAVAGTQTLTVATESRPPWYAELVAGLVALFGVIGSWFAWIVGKGGSRILAVIFERFGKKLDAERAAEAERFIEERVRAAQERYLSGKIKETAEKGASKLLEVTNAVKARFPSLSAADIDAKIHAVVDKLPGVGATK